MLRKLMLFMLIGVLAGFGSIATAQEDDVPTVAIIRFGPLQPFELSEKGTLDVLEANGFVDGENINIIFGDAAFDFPTANQLVEDAIDEGADVIIAITTPVAQAAVNATLEMENPPVVLFNTVTDPYIAGLASASCIKPDHVWGSQALAPYADVVDLLFELNPDIQTVGYMYNNAEANSVASTEIVTALAEEAGLTLEIQTVNETAEVGIAAEALVERGVEAFLLPTDSTVSDGLPALLQVSEEVGIPIVHSDSGQVYGGATIAEGLSYYQEGIDTAQILIAYLNGELDIATTRIAVQAGTQLAINLDSAALQGVEIPEALIERAAYVIEGGESSEVPPELDMSEGDMADAAAAYLESLACTPELIEEQQAELDAMSDE